MRITRTIEIDAGHRIPEHGNKCRNLHGHRYVIQATVGSKDLQTEGQERGMVMDFGRVKDSMMAQIHDRFDHKLILRWDDPVVQTLLGVKVLRFSQASQAMACLSGELVLIQDSPTAERLAELWFNLMRRDLGAHLLSLRVYETPNCFADYAG